MPEVKLRHDYIKARKLRAKMSLPEVLLWQYLRRQPLGVKFRRQHPVGPFVIDFYCPMARLGMEIDGIAHSMGNRPERDAARDEWLTVRGIEILRIPAEDVLKSAVDVAEAIVRHCRCRG